MHSLLLPAASRADPAQFSSAISLQPPVDVSRGQLGDGHGHE